MACGVFGFVRLRDFPHIVARGVSVGGCGVELEGGCGRDTITADCFGDMDCCLMWMSEPAETLRLKSIFGGGNTEVLVALYG